ncbi:hypothetical protein BT93_L5034 [Corymbia citriodora subsp. variegata]|uniref:Uncharacterized protein n=1 Tax=Corymbia citriodora subsp. variegata TaxID=360336 RepID=A0A8T0CXL4_CORYI|nr:hypothetical protein BT93_L5034 [Corymbia citriodora subsp. variegata]
MEGLFALMKFRTAQKPFILSTSGPPGTLLVNTHEQSSLPHGVASPVSWRGISSRKCRKQGAHEFWLLNAVSFRYELSCKCGVRIKMEYRALISNPSSRT